MRLCISGQALGYARPLEGILEILNANQVNAIELWPCNSPATDAAARDGGYAHRDLPRVRELCAQYGVEVACVTMGGTWDAEMVADEAHYARELLGAVDAAHFLGASIVNHYFVPAGSLEGSELSFAMRRWEPAIARAEELGITLVLENEAHDATRTPDGMLRVLQSVGSRAFRTNLDACNYYHASSEGFPRGYELLKDYIAYVHIKNGCICDASTPYCADVKGSPMSGAFAPAYIGYPTLASGAVNIDGLLLALTRDGYGGFCTLEPHVPSDMVEAYYRSEVGYLRSRGFFAL